MRSQFINITSLRLLFPILVAVLIYSAPIAFTQTYSFKNYNVENGLSQSQVLSIFQDNPGNLWVGTNGEGIWKFSGKSNITITKKDGLTGNYIYSIVQDSKGKMWFGTNNGISIYDGHKYTNITVDQGLPHNRVYCITEDKFRDQIWIATENGVAIYKDGKISLFNQRDLFTKTFVFTILVDKKNTVWFGTFGRGLIRYRDDVVKKYTTDDGLNKDVIRMLKQDNKGNILIGTLNGLNYYDYSTDKINNLIINNDPNSVNTVTGCIVQKSGDIWISLYSGTIHKLRYIQGKLKLVFSIYSIGNAKNIWTIVEDKENNIWLGTIDYGLFKFGGLRFLNFNEENDGLQSNSVYAICQSKDGKYWVGTKNSGLSRMTINEQNNKADFINYSYDLIEKKGKPIKQLRMSGSSCTSVMQDHQGSIWVTSTNGLTMIRNDSIFNYLPSKSENKLIKAIIKPGLTSPACNHIIQDSHGTYWVGTNNGVTKILDTNFINFNKTYPVLAKKNIYRIYEDHKRQLWFLTDSGVYVYDYNKLKHYGRKDGLVDEMVVAVSQDKQNNYWFGTKEGVFFYNPAKGFRNIDMKAGLASNNIYLLIFDDRRNLIIGTPKGLDMLDVKKYIDNNVSDIRHFGNLEGFIGQECNLNACYKDKKGRIWFGTIKGVTIYDPAFDRKNIIKPITQLTNIKLEYKDFDWGPYCNGYDSITRLPKNLVLPYNKNNITFEFVAASLMLPENVRYKVMLEGLDKKWSPARSKNEAEYPSLAPGTYTFRVIACNNDGVWADEALSFTFTINPPFWQTWWFYTIAIILILVIIYFVIKRREHAILQKNIKLEQKVNQRTAELRQANEEISAQRDELESQRDIVTLQNAKLEGIIKEVSDSINYAKRLQTSAFPNIKIIKDHFNDHFILYKPKDVVSGDFYWFAKVESQLVVAVADCTGHGVPGAFMSILGMSLLKEIVINEYITQPDVILRRLRKEVIKAIGQTGSQGEQKDGMDISLCSINTETMMLQWAGANNPCFIINDGKAKEFKADKMPIAIYEKMDKFTLHEVPINKGCMIYMWGDGYQDQFGGPNGKKFMSKKFRELLLSISEKPMKEQHDILDDTIERWKCGYGTIFEQTDDITVMGLKI